jgi:hypothetical protein
MSQPIVIRDEYTRRVSGETFQYEAAFQAGEQAQWSAHVYLNGELKGEPKGSVTRNTMNEEELKQYIIAYIEGMIERGIGIEE